MNDIIAQMVADIMETANPVFNFHECVEDLDSKWVWFDDSILSLIGRSQEPGLETAKTLLNRMHTRDLYSMAGEVLIPLSK
jgi:hypothetical protein